MRDFVGRFNKNNPEAFRCLKPPFKEVSVQLQMYASYYNQVN